MFLWAFCVLLNKDCDDAQLFARNEVIRDSHFQSMQTFFSYESKQSKWLITSISTEAPRFDYALLGSSNDSKYSPPTTLPHTHNKQSGAPPHGSSSGKVCKVCVLNSDKHLITALRTHCTAITHSAIWEYSNKNSSEACLSLLRLASS